ncbi:MAG: ATP synthase subunit I [Gammaproteobacteria bacterium]|nr:ATP synthase subunit I [Gammaproteobacteria bacterium]
MSLLRSFRKLAALQLTLILVTSVLFYWWNGAGAAVATLFGGGIAMVNVALLLWRRTRAERGRAMSAGESMRLLYRSALERFIAVIALFALGMGVLKLYAPALLTGFIVGQLALLFTEKERKSERHGV